MSSYMRMLKFAILISHLHSTKCTQKSRNELVKKPCGWVTHIPGVSDLSKPKNKVSNIFSLRSTEGEFIHAKSLNSFSVDIILKLILTSLSRPSRMRHPEGEFGHAISRCVG